MVKVSYKDGSGIIMVDIFVWKNTKLNSVKSVFGQITNSLFVQRDFLYILCNNTQGCVCCVEHLNRFAGIEFLLY